MFQPQQDGVVLLADSAHPVENTLIDNDAQRSSHSGRQTENKNERAHLSVSKVKAAKQPSPPVCVN